MGRKTRSTAREGDHWPGLPASPPVSIEAACRLHERALALREHGQHAEAAACARHALASFARECGPDHPDVANILNNLAGICADQGDYAEAVRLAQRSVTIMEQATGSPDLELLRVQSFRTLAGVYRDQGRYPEAEALYQQALALAEATLASDHLETAACLNDLGVLYKYTARFATLRVLRANVSLDNRVLDSRFRGNDALLVMPALASARAGCGGHPVFCMGARGLSWRLCPHAWGPCPQTLTPCPLPL